MMITRDMVDECGVYSVSEQTYFFCTPSELEQAKSALGFDALNEEVIVYIREEIRA